MGNKYSLLDWDSHLFGYGIASIRPDCMTHDELDKVIHELKKNRIRLLYCFVNPDDELSINSIEEASGKLVDTKITFFTSISRDIKYQKSDFIRPYDLKYTSGELKKLAFQSGLFSRFKIDPNFQNYEFEKLYTEWIEKSVRKEISDEVLVYYEDNIEKGFVTVAIKKNTGVVGLIAVDEGERGKSIGKKLMNAVLTYLSEKNTYMVEVATQKANEAACRFYETLGFEIKNTINVYHLWII